MLDLKSSNTKKAAESNLFNFVVVMWFNSIVNGNGPYFKTSHLAFLWEVF